jgi:hypothetical protein
VHHCIDFDDKWALLAAGNLALSIQESGSLRSEGALSLLRRIPHLTLEMGLLHHQALLGESLVEIAFTHAHFEVFDDYQVSNWQFLPYVRLMGEQKTFDWSGKSVLAFQTGLRGAYAFEFAPLIWTWSTDFLQRFDLDEYTINISLGFKWDFTRNNYSVTKT